MLETTSIDRPRLADEQLEVLNKEELVAKWRLLNSYVDSLENKLASVESHKSLEIAKLKNIILMKYISSKQLESTVNKTENIFFTRFWLNQRILSIFNLRINLRRLPRPHRLR